MPAEQRVYDLLDVAGTGQGRAVQHAATGRLEIGLHDGLVKVRVALNPVAKGRDLVDGEFHDGHHS